MKEKKVAGCQGGREIVSGKLQVKNKAETQKKKLLEMQLPTSVQIEKQVSVEVDNQLNQKVCVSLL